MWLGAQCLRELSPDGGPVLAIVAKAQTNPTAASRLFLTWRLMITVLRPEARVTGAEPA
jgi:hypothetical protein